MVWLPPLLFAIFGLCSVALILVGLPGTWILLGVAMILELVDGLWLAPGVTTTFGWWVLVIGIAAAGVGELIELWSGVVGADMGGGSRRSKWGAFAGGLLGALAGTALIPIPVVGTLIGVLLGTFLGAMGAEMTGAQKKGGKEALKPAIGATIGRVLGIVAKLSVGMFTWAWLVAVALARVW